MQSVDIATVISAAISGVVVVVVALIPKKEVKRLRSENSDQHLVNKAVADDIKNIVSRFEADAEYDRKSILKAVTAVERKVENVDTRVERIDNRLGNHIEWHLDRD